MERTVPSTASEEIDLYLRTIYSLLRSTAVVKIRTLEEVHAGINSALHPDARKLNPDPSAFIYSVLRLPTCMPEVHTVILGQSSIVFRQHNYDAVESWEMVSAPARRRKCFLNDGKLACFIASRTDIEDVIPTLTAYQIEWNKIHDLFIRNKYIPQFFSVGEELNALRQLSNVLLIPIEDLQRLRAIWPGDTFIENFRIIAAKRCDLGVQLLSGSLSEYWRATRVWWDNIELATPSVIERPIYFVSSNSHSIANMLSGYALTMRDELIHYLYTCGFPELISEWEEISPDATKGSQENFLYYLLKKYQSGASASKSILDQTRIEQDQGILRIPSQHSFDLEAQVIDLSKINPNQLDSRLRMNDLESLRNSDALIVNVDYPLGLAAYNILAKIAEHSSPILGVYFMGKSATLNGVLGDVLIPNVVHDEHSQNTYLFQNAFSAAQVSPYLWYGNVLDNQKAVTVLGTFLQNSRVMDVIYREGYTDIEMEAGPYLSAVYEMYRPKRHPVNEIVNLYEIPFDLGILHYASDTPMSKGRNLGAGALSYRGMDPTYAATTAIIRRILSLELLRIRQPV
jgi:hypothetical protein